MPAGYAHLMITEQALKGYSTDNTIDPKLRGYALTSHFVKLGSVGPDYPYLDFFQPNQKAWADHMHYDLTGDLIITIAKKLLDTIKQGIDKEEFKIPFCWALGYLSHVTADLVVHPVVYNIVGSYTGHEEEHRHCEMIQDAFIYNKLRNGAEIEHSQLINMLSNCSNPNNRHEIHSVLGFFWDDVLNTHFPSDFTNNQPDIDEWHDEFEDWLGLAGRPTFVGRILDTQNKYTYKKSTQINYPEKRSFLVNLPLPGGTRGDYEAKVFPKAVRHVTEKWISLSQGLSANNLTSFISTISNCDLDTGKDKTTGKLVYW
jgi:hypothetical protein